MAVGDLRSVRLDEPRPDPDSGQGAEYRRRLSALVDSALAGLWADACEQVLGGGDQGVALAVVGSQGRRDAGPLSDLDLLLVHDGVTVPEARRRELADALWYPLWDARIDIDHSVRSVAECRQVASADLVSAVGLLDVRHVAGDASIVEEARAALRADWRSAARTRLGALLDSLRERAVRSGELAYLVEPDLKEARGGLRDAVVIRALVASWLVERPHLGQERAYEELLDIRDALSSVTGRPATRLSRADAPEVASALGHDDPDDLLANIAQAARTISGALDVTVRYATRAQRKPDRLLTRPWIVRGRRMARKLPEVVSDVAELSGELVLAPDVDPAGKPGLPLRVAAAAARLDLPIAPVTLQNLTRAPDLPTPWPARARADLLTLLGTGQAQIPVWEACDLAGLVVRWIPQWGAVRNRPQRSPVHRYTVDRHLVQTAANAADLLGGASIGGLAVTLGPERREALLLAAILHDIGKVAGAEDHSVTGARIAGDVLRDLGVPEECASLVVRLVAEHLTLAEAATTEDPDDPEVVRRIADAVDGDVEVLIALRLLTEADASAAGPQAWTSWRASLVDGLTHRVHACLAGR